MQWPVIEAAVRASMLELHFEGDELEKTAAVAGALLDVIDLCLEYGLIDNESEHLPAELDFYLRNVYHYMGDPLECTASAS